MNAYYNLAEFTLADHGDTRERHWTSRVAPHFRAYEQFWRWYIVPLTNRIDPNISAVSPEWTSARADISNTLEQMAMHHYSVFYYFARATERIQQRNMAFPEDVFALLDSCGDNVNHFFQRVSAVTKDFGLSIALPTQRREMGAFLEVEKYRNAFVHNAVLARTVDGDRVLLPKLHALDKAQSSWREAAQLAPEHWIDCDELYQQVHGGVAQFLEQKWAEIVFALNTARDKNQNKFNTQWAIEKFMPCLIGPPTASTAQPVSPSGTCFPGVLGTASNSTTR